MRNSEGLSRWLFGRLSKGRRRKPAKGANRRDRRLSIEPLEARKLLSAAGLTVSAMPTIIVSQGTPTKVVPLTGVFHDANGAAVLRYSIEGDTNESLLASPPLAISSGYLAISPAPAATGTTILTVKATDPSGESAECDVTVEVVAPGSSAITSSGNTSGADGRRSIGDNAISTSQSQSDTPDVAISVSDADGNTYQLTAFGASGSALQAVSLADAFQQLGISTAGLRYQIEANSAPSFFASTPVVIPPGDLVARIAADAAGTASLTVRATDQSGQTTNATIVFNVSSGDSGSSFGASGFGSDFSSFMQDDESGGSSGNDLSPGAGIITTVAGSPTISGYSGDGGLGAKGKLNNPSGVAVDAAGNYFIADTNNYVIREVNAGTGVITTVAGNGIGGYSGDGGQATSAELKSPVAVALDAGDLFIADSGNNVIRKVDLSTGVITTVAGNGTAGYSSNGGAATSAELWNPQGVAVDTEGDLYIANSYNNVVRKVDLSTGVITTAAGNGTANYSGDGGQAMAATFDSPSGVAVDTAGDIFIADTFNNVIREVVHSTGEIITVAGNGDSGYNGDGGQATDAQLTAPTAVAVDAAGDLFIADNGNDVVRAVDHATGLISTIAGDNVWGYSGDGGPATAAALNFPTGVALNAAGDLFIADASNNTVREVTGLISTVAGDGVGSYIGSGSQLYSPLGVAVDAAGDIFTADIYANVIREVNASSGVISIVAGGGTDGYIVNGVPATDAGLNNPCDVAVDAAGDIFIADTYDNVIREVNTSGDITTVAGDGVGGYSGDNGPATDAELNQPCGVAVDAAGDIFIADSGNNVIREVNHATHTITTVAGNYNDDNPGFSGDGGPAIEAAAQRPVWLGGGRGRRYLHRRQRQQRRP